MGKTKLLKHLPFRVPFCNYFGLLSGNLKPYSPQLVYPLKPGFKKIKMKSVIEN